MAASEVAPGAAISTSSRTATRATFVSWSSAAASSSRASARECTRDALALLGVPSARRFPRDERLAFESWAPLLTILPGVSRWSAVEKSTLVDVIRARGGRRESDFVRRFDLHAKMRQALMKLVRTTHE